MRMPALERYWTVDDLDDLPDAPRDTRSSTAICSRRRPLRSTIKPRLALCIAASPSMSSASESATRSCRQQMSRRRRRRVLDRRPRRQNVRAVDAGRLTGRSARRRDRVPTWRCLYVVGDCSAALFRRGARRL